MKNLTRVVLAGTRGVNLASIVAVGILVLVLTVVVLLQVLYRYVLELPLVWSDEAARLLLVWLTFVGGGVAIAQGLHPRIEMIDSIRAPRLRMAIEVAVLVAVLAFLVCLLVISADVARTYVAYRSLGLGWSQAIPRAALPAGACLMAINVLAKLLEVLDRREAVEQRVVAW